MEFEDFKTEWAYKAEVHSVLERIKQLKNESIVFNAGQRIIAEGEKTDVIYFILEGQAEILKQGHGELVVDKFGPGDFIGLTAFLTKQPSLLESLAVSEVTCLRLHGVEPDHLTHEHPQVREIIQRLFISNLATRTRRMIGLNIKVAELGTQLKDRNRELNEAMQKLEHTRNQMIHREKLATLGQLLAGIAHEINNPCAALSRGVENLIEDLPKLLENNLQNQNSKLTAQMLRAGLDCPYWNSEVKHERMNYLMQTYSGMKRSLARRLARMSEETLSSLPCLKEKLSAEAMASLEHQLDYFDAGTYLRTVSLSSERIQKLVLSLKNYGKQDQGQAELFDIREGIHNTLIVLNNKLKNYRVNLNLEPIENLYCHGGEINQVWTNILINACQATPQGGEIDIRSYLEKDDIKVSISDSGHGIDPQLLGQIFEPNFTTKNTKADFGLGLGLAISREIIAKHGGRIEVANREKGGACFTVCLPLSLKDKYPV